MALFKYRYYRFESSGRIYVAESLHAANDEDAIMQVGRKHPDGTCEVWQATRLVAKLSRHRFEPDDPEVQNAVAARLTARVLRIRAGLEEIEATNRESYQGSTSSWNLALLLDEMGQLCLNPRKCLLTAFTSFWLKRNA